jgi:hypothetical protein
MTISLRKGLPVRCQLRLALWSCERERWQLLLLLHFNKNSAVLQPAVTVLAGGYTHV